MLVYPFLKAAANAVTNIKSCCTEFRVGETPLQSMAKQLNDNDDSTIYYADGIITLYGMEELEVLLLETSSFFGSKKNDKKCFDHHKGLFGSLSMIKTVADEYYLGSIENFSKIKIIFIQAAGTTFYNTICIKILNTFKRQDNIYLEFEVYCRRPCLRALVRRTFRY